VERGALTVPVAELAADAGGLPAGGDPSSNRPTFPRALPRLLSAAASPRWSPAVAAEVSRQAAQKVVSQIPRSVRQ